MHFGSVVVFLVPVEHQGRKCVFRANSRNVERARISGRVNGSVQYCSRTQCCMGFFLWADGHLQAVLQGCSVLDVPCTNSECSASTRVQNCSRCFCNSDLCNSNITWSLQAEQPQQSNSQDTPATSHGLEATRCSCDIPGNSDIDLTTVNLEKVLAHGHFATVWHCSRQGTVVALKVFPNQHKQAFITETEVYGLPLMIHAGIAHFLGAGQLNTGELVLVLQMASHGSLNSFLAKYACNWEDTWKLSLCLAQGLAYLHSDLYKNGVHKPPVAHRDLSSSNVLVQADGTCALCDFGCATIMRSCKSLQQWQLHFGGSKEAAQAGTLRYTSPEILEGCVNLSSGRCLLQGDVYALGLLLWEIWMRCSDLYSDGPVPAHHLPYETEVGTNPSLEQLLIFVSEKRGRPTAPATWVQVSQEFSLHEILEDCWDHDPEARLTALCVANRLSSLESPCTF
ncbi:anti-Muellerian hormone type-2 receptor-like [Denticeps clupeoides]|uniref:anti-Muellerian hormone type-2 receptor-like n=1 Tax=Denticeps clupeoides TaxID=299321 RepID=UPI0010A45D1E|nr:anti-Muellerian hormone type-2 receptor [Denticeps clupeoides]